MLCRPIRFWWNVTTQHPEGLRLLHAAGSAGAIHLFLKPDRLMLELFNIVGIIIK